MDSWKQHQKNHKHGFILKVVPVIFDPKRLSTVLETCHYIPFIFFCSLWFCSKLKGQYTASALTNITESGGAGFCVIWSWILSCCKLIFHGGFFVCFFACLGLVGFFCLVCLVGWLVFCFFVLYGNVSGAFFSSWNSDCYTYMAHFLIFLQYISST